MWPSLTRVEELHRIFYRKCPTYKPATGTQLPSYFYSMLDDADRSLQYWRGIQACVEELRPHLSDSLVAVDVGVGTGLLSAFALQSGADIVVGVDVNEAALRAAQRGMLALDAARNTHYADRFVAILVESTWSETRIANAVNAKLAERHVQRRSFPFDMIVSEILGTLVYGESMAKYLPPYMHLTAEHNGKLHAVPQKCEQMFGVYAFSVPRHIKLAVEHALERLEASQRYAPTDSRGLGIPLYAFERESRSAPQAFYSATYSSNDRIDMHKHSQTRKTIEFTTVPDALNLGVCEWTCTLWADVRLENTLQRCTDIAAEFDDRYALARENAWGFMVCNLDGIRQVFTKFTKGECLELELRTEHGGAYVLNDVAINECSWLSSVGDTDLATRVTDAFAARALPDAPTTIVHVVNEVTCGAICEQLLARFAHIRLHVSYTHDGVRSHEATVRFLQQLNNPRCTHEPTGTRKRRQEHPVCSCMIVPELYYMRKDHAERVDFFRSIGGDKLLPDVRQIRTRANNYACSIAVAPTQCVEIETILQTVGALKQVETHPDVHFSTRDFFSIPFLAPGGAVAYSVHQVISDRQDDPCANIDNVRALVQAKDIQSACARMLGGSGLFVRFAGDANNPLHPDNADISEGSDSDGADDDDDDSDSDYVA